MPDQERLPEYLEVPEEHQEALDVNSIKPTREGKYLTYALFVILQNLEVKRRVYRYGMELKPGQTALLEYLRALFAVLSTLERPQQSPKKQNIEKQYKDQAEKNKPLYEDRVPFIGKAITREKGPYALPTRYFNALIRNDLIRSGLGVIMADEVANLTESQLEAATNIDRTTIEAIKKLLERIKIETEGGVDGSPFLVPVPSMYFGVTFGANEFSPTVDKGLQLQGCIDEFGTVDAYKVASLTEKQLWEAGALGKFVDEIKTVLTRHAHDIYLKK